MKNIPEVNDHVTIHNINPKYHDRSYQCEVWEVIAINKTHAQLKSCKNRNPLFDMIIILLDEYEFSDAKSFSI